MMKAEHLIKILGAVDPESEVNLQIGSDDDKTYRDLCAMAELANGDCLDCLEIKSAEINIVDDEPKIKLILSQWNYKDIEDGASGFADMYTPIRQREQQPDNATE